MYTRRGWYTKCELHAAHTADLGASAVIIKSSDSDVAVITLSVSYQINTQLIFRTGTQHRTRYLDLSAIGQALGQKVCSTLPGYHVFSGCDSTSAFTGWGNVSEMASSFSRMMNHSEALWQKLASHSRRLQSSLPRRKGNLYPMW